MFFEKCERFVARLKVATNADIWVTAVAFPLPFQVLFEIALSCETRPASTAILLRVFVKVCLCSVQMTTEIFLAADVLATLATAVVISRTKTGRWVGMFCGAQVIAAHNANQ
jgi:hypothetical protein